MLSPGDAASSGAGNAGGPRQLRYALPRVLAVSLLATPASGLQGPAKAAALEPWRQSTLYLALENSTLPPGEAVSHRVEHSELLNKDSFWYLMGALILCVAVAVVRLEVQVLNSESSDQAGGVSTAATTPDAKEPEAKDANLEEEEEEEASVIALTKLSDPGAGDLSGVPTQEALRYGRQQQEVLVKDVDDETRGVTVKDAAHLLCCVAALNAAMVLWGISQEYIMTTTYGGDFIPDSWGLILCNRVVSASFCGVLLLIRGGPLLFEGFQWAAPPAISNALASWCQYSSLNYVVFTLQTTAKSAKLLPVLVLSSLRGKKHSLLDYAEILVIVIGLVVFGLETEVGTPTKTAAIGLVLLTGLVVFDAATPHLQDMLFIRNPEVAPLQATFAMSTVAAIGLLVVELFTGDLVAWFNFLTLHPQAILHLAVLSCSSTLTQYFMSYTIKNFGPVILTLITSTRQLISVSISAVLFQHRLPGLSIIALVIVCSMLVVRAVRQVATDQARHLEDRDPSDADEIAADPFAFYNQPMASSVAVLSRVTAYAPLLVCAVAIHVVFCFYAICQEFLSIHTFTGDIFNFPTFNIAVNHTCGAFLGILVLRLQRLPVCTVHTGLTVLPAATNFVATFCQHQALYFMLFPAQTLMKTLKVVPVMVVGRLLNYRSYNTLDYAEGILITAFVAYFVWDFQMQQESETMEEAHDSRIGILLMVGYIIADSFTSNLEDGVYQQTHLDPGQMLFGLELASAVAAWITIIVDGTLVDAVRFLASHHHILLYVVLLALASATGAYACTLTVRLFGPAIFTLLMTSRQVCSMVISVGMFGHTVHWANCLCLIAVSLLTMTSSLRRVSKTLDAAESREQQKLGPATEQRDGGRGGETAPAQRASAPVPPDVGRQAET